MGYVVLTLLSRALLMSIRLAIPPPLLRKWSIYLWNVHLICSDLCPPLNACLLCACLSEEMLALKSASYVIFEYELKSKGIAGDFSQAVRNLGKGHKVVQCPGLSETINEVFACYFYPVSWWWRGLLLLLSEADVFRKTGSSARSPGGVTSRCEWVHLSCSRPSVVQISVCPSSNAGFISHQFDWTPRMSSLCIFSPANVFCVRRWRARLLILVPFFLIACKTFEVFCYDALYLILPKSLV